MNFLHETAQTLVASGKGILAADESISTMTKRLDDIKVESTVDSRRKFRQLLFSTPAIEAYISGVILFDETIRQSSDNDKLFTEILSEKGIIPGIKVDLGTDVFEHSDIEKMTNGLDTLADRLSEYHSLGARFAKWRAVYSITENTPTDELILQNAKDLALYAKLCQDAQIVPIVEPEVLMNGSHSIDECFIVTKKVQHEVFDALVKEDVDFAGMLLKPNMVMAGTDAEHIDPAIVAQKTVDCLKSTVHKDVPGIVFLSGGQSEEKACLHLSLMNQLDEELPWKLSFSYGRALQSSTLKAWKGDMNNIDIAQEVFTKRAKLCSLASEGKYESNME